MIYDMTEQVLKAREYFDAMLTKKIEHLQEQTGIERERFVKLNPADFVERWEKLYIANYEYRNIGKWVAETKTDDNFIISPLDNDEETANQIAYKTNQVQTKLRASKCDILPIPKQTAKDFFVKNHRQSLPLLSANSINFALVYGGYIVAVMSYDITNGGVRGDKGSAFELLRLAIKKGYLINGGASRLQKHCEEAMRQIGVTEIYSYSNATINNGKVYEQLGFIKGKVEGGQAWVVDKHFNVCRLLHSKWTILSGVYAHNCFKTHLTANRLWTKRLDDKPIASLSE